MRSRIHRMSDLDRAALLHRLARSTSLARPALEPWLKTVTTERQQATNGGSYLDLQQPRGVLVIDFLQNCFGQLNAINPPTSLRRHFGRSVVKILVLCL